MKSPVRTARESCDCETTTDIRQDLNFLWWRFCELRVGTYVCQQEGLVYADTLDGASIDLIHAYARSKRAQVEDGCPENILVQSRTEFVDGEFWQAIQAGAVIVCFNAPFDLSRLALDYREAQRKNSGWSMVMWEHEGKPDSFKPKLRIKPKDSRSAFINLAGGDPNNRVVYRGRFLDLSVLGWSLRNRHMTLDGFLGSFGLKGKMDHEPTGLVTKKEIAYGRRDVERTVALLNAMKREYDGFPIDLSPERAMSAASITKEFLKVMGIKQPAQKFSLPDEVLGKCMQAYYGGRSEIRIRHQEVPVVVCDTTSEYPSVAGLLGLWPLLTAANLDVVDCTAEARDILNGVDVQSILKPSKWLDLAFFASNFRNTLSAAAENPSTTFCSDKRAIPRFSITSRRWFSCMRRHKARIFTPITSTRCVPFSKRRQSFTVTGIFPVVSKKTRMTPMEFCTSGSLIS
jgi:hypothetical protein